MSKFSPLGAETRDMELVPTRTRGLILVQDKSRGSQASPAGPHRPATRGGTRDCGIWRGDEWVAVREDAYLSGPSNKQKMPVLQGFPGRPPWI